MLPLWDSQPHRRKPVLVALLITACLVVFAWEVVQLTASEPAFERWLTGHALVPGRLVKGWTDPQQWETILTSMFLHGGVAHLLGNCWFLWVFGNNVEDRVGSLGFGVFYFICGVFAGLCQVAVDPSSTTPMIGASGAISGVLGAYLVWFPRSWVVSLVPWIVPILPIPALIFLPLWFFAQAYAGVGGLLSGEEAAGGIAWWAHAGGFIAGFLVALAWPFRRPR